MRHIGQEITFRPICLFRSLQRIFQGRIHMLQLRHPPAPVAGRIQYPQLMLSVKSNYVVFKMLQRLLRIYGL